MSIHTLMFGWEYPPVHLGGLGVACQGLVKGLLKNNVKVTFVLPHPDGEENGVDFLSPTEEIYRKIRVQSALIPYESCGDFDIRMIEKREKGIHSIYGQDMGEAVAAFTESSIEMAKNVRPDVIHCHDWMTYAAGIRSARYHRKPLVAHIHATEMDRTHFRPNEWIYKREKDGFEAANKIIAVSAYTKNILVKHYGIAPDKISVVHNGSIDHVNFDAIHSSLHRHTEHPLVLFLGRLVLQKGVNQFLDMAVKVHEQRPEVEFMIAGDGPMLGECIDRSCSLGLQDSIIFTGKIDSKEVRALYRQADCFVMPSLSEPFGLVALEAISQGTPVVLSKQSGASEVIDHCFTADFWDTDRMADCVLTILREEPLAHQLISEAPRVIQKLTWENQASQVHSIYKQLQT